MAAPATGDPLAGGGKPAAAAKSGRQRRMLLALAGVGVLAAIVLLTRGQSGDAPAAADGTFNTALPPTGSTFADNGEAAGQLGSDLTTVTGELASLGDRLTPIEEFIAGQTPAAAATTPAPQAAAPGPLGAVATPAPPANGPGTASMTVGAQAASSGPPIPTVLKPQQGYQPLGSGTGVIKPPLAQGGPVLGLPPKKKKK